jgi:hypothetical protein
MGEFANGIPPRSVSLVTNFGLASAKSTSLLSLSTILAGLHLSSFVGSSAADTRCRRIPAACCWISFATRPDKGHPLNELYWIDSSPATHASRSCRHSGATAVQSVARSRSRRPRATSPSDWAACISISQFGRWSRHEGSTESQLIESSSARICTATSAGTNAAWTVATQLSREAAQSGLTASQVTFRSNCSSAVTRCGTRCWAAASRQMTILKKSTRPSTATNAARRFVDHIAKYPLLTSCPVRTSRG